MKVKLKTFGGIAAGIRRPERFLDTADLPADAAAELDALIASAKPGGKPGRPAPDAMSYEVTIEKDGDAQTLTGSDAAMSDDFGNLVEWLEDHAK